VVAQKSQLPSSREYLGFTLLLLIIVIVVPLYAFSYRSTNPPTTLRSPIGDLQLRSTSVGIANVGYGGPILNINVVVYNPTGFEARLDEANYSVYANALYVGSGQTSHGFDISPQSTQSLTFSVNMSWKSSFQTVRSYITGWGNVTWDVNGTADIEVDGLPLTITFGLVVD
jgi:LEA14-like dessication related protein